MPKFTKGSAKPPNSGRKKGTPNKDKKALLAKIQEKFPGFCPIEVMCQFAIDEAKEDTIRLQASKEVASYIYPKLKSVEVTGSDGGDLKIEIVNFHKGK